MNILFLGNFQGRGWDGSITDENHIADALEGLGHGVTRMQRQESLAVNPDMWDMTLIAQWDGYKELVNLPHPVVYWAFDYQEQNQEWHCRLIKASDLYLSKRIEDKRFPNWQWLSQDFAPMFLDKTKNDYIPEMDVLFTGSYLPWATERNETLKTVDDKFDLHIYSVTPDQWKEQGFKNAHGPVMDSALPELYARAKINLSIDHTIERGYWSDRNAQIMCCGGFVLFRYVPMSEATFHNKVAYFENIEQCIFGINWYLDNEEDRKLLAHEGYIHAKNYLTVHDRVVDLLTIV